MAGIERDGLKIKRQLDVISDLKKEAETIFQDLVPVDDVVDTSDSTTLGRLIGLVSFPLSDLWEAIQEVYSAFDPNSAYGIALDNLAMYAHMTRLPATSTQALVVAWGDPGTVIQESSAVRALDNSLFRTPIRVVLDNTSCIGVRVKLDEVIVSTTYSISVLIGNGTTTATYTANGGDTPEDVLNSLKSTLNNVNGLTVNVTEEEMVVECEDITNLMNVTLTNLNAIKFKKGLMVFREEAGRFEYLANTINRIATPTLGWDDVNNPLPAIPGSDRESDDQLRNRFRDSKFSIAQNIADSLYARLIAIPQVEHVKIYENITNVYDSTYDLNPYTFKVLILGGDDETIANTIWIDKPLGIASQGDINVPINDTMSNEHIISFQRPSPKRIYITVEATKNNLFPNNGPERMRAELVNYFRDNFTVGDDVIHSRLFTPLNTIIGHEVTALKIGTSASPSGQSSISIAYDEIPTLDDNDINIIIN